MQYFMKYLTSAPIVAVITAIALFAFFIELNHVFPGLQYGTYFHPAP